MAQSAGKHYFLLNPAAGIRSARVPLEKELRKITGTPYELHATRSDGDAARLVREICEKEQGTLRFYACGGDGTLGEAATGAFGFPQAAVGIWPCGSGNDYVKSFGGKARFLDIPAQIKAPLVPVDLIRVGERCAINAVNLGFEAEAADIMLRYRRSLLFGGKRAYLPGILGGVLRHMRTNCRVSADGVLLHEGPMLTLTLASGQYIGGGYRSAPQAVTDDGLLEMSLMRPMTRARLLTLIGIYKRGGHLTHPAFKEYMLYRRIRHLEMDCERDSALCLDGEIIRGRHFEAEVLPRALSFILPLEV